MSAIAGLSCFTFIIACLFFSFFLVILYICVLCLLPPWRNKVYIIIASFRSDENIRLIESIDHSETTSLRKSGDISLPSLVRPA